MAEPEPINEDGVPTQTYWKVAPGHSPNAATISAVGARAARAPQPLPVVPGYTIEREIGHGGMGTVYLARDPFGAVFALKTIRADRVGAVYVERFLREKSALQALYHPHVVRIFHAGKTDDASPFFTMPYYERGTLADHLAEYEADPRKAVSLMINVAEAVHYLHEKGRIHRDLKPQNILLSDNNEVFVSDFGLVKDLETFESAEVPAYFPAAASTADPFSKVETTTQATAGVRTAGVIGTMPYMSPEQLLRRREPIGPQSDVWALGVMLYELLCGVRPFEADDNEVLSSLIRQEPPPPVRTHRMDVTANLERIVMKCLEKIPLQRYSSAKALADDLGKWLTNQHPQSHPGRLTWTAQTLRRHKLWLAAGVVGATLIALAIIFWPRDPDKPLREMQAELAQGRPVTMIGETGKPKWYRWKAGEEGGKIATAADGAFTIHASDLCLLELLPAIDCRHYRFSIQIRHEKSNRPGEVGLYFGHRAFEANTTHVQFFTQLTFNDVKGPNDLPVVIGEKGEIKRSKNVVYMLPQYYLKLGTRPMHWGMPGRSGPTLEPAGEGRAGWRELSITVSPTEVVAEWDKQRFNLDPDDIMRRSREHLAEKKLHYPENALIQSLDPNYTPGGGLGIYLSNGSASFRFATITPLKYIP